MKMKMLSRKFSLAAGLLSVALLAFAAGYMLKPDQRVGIEAVIIGQIEAFKRDDRAAAFAFAAPSIQAQFKTPNSFMRMVAAAYPQVVRPQRIDFLDMIEEKGQVLQKVLLIDQDGNDALAAYTLIMIDGAWRITGCFVAEAPGQAI